MLAVLLGNRKSGSHREGAESSVGQTLGKREDSAHCGRVVQDNTSKGHSSMFERDEKNKPQTVALADVDKTSKPNLNQLNIPRS